MILCALWIIDYSKSVFDCQLVIIVPLDYLIIACLVDCMQLGNEDNFAIDLSVTMVVDCCVVRAYFSLLYIGVRKNASG